jgi:hypothetical protein
MATRGLPVRAGRAGLGLGGELLRGMIGSEVMTWLHY